jgi:hypothetical protein
MKRALMTFGNPFGLALYDKEQRQVVEVQPEPEPPRERLQPTDLNAMIEEILRMQTTVALRKWWKQTAEFRKSVGLVDGTEEYQLLYTTFANHGKKLAAGESVNG